MRWALLLLLAGCGRGAPRTVTVLAASSLTDAFDALETSFEAAHPDVDVVVSYAGSQALATQVRHGIAADVFASANEAHIAALADEGRVQRPRAFAHNRLVLAVSDRFDGDVDLPSLPSVGSLVVGGPEVPIGRYTAGLFDAAEAAYGAEWRQAVEARIVSREPNVRLVVAKVGLGEADAAVVYRTDLSAMDGVRAVELPAALSPRATYLHARLEGSSELGAAWLAHVESAEGRRVLAEHGFVVDGSRP